MKVFKYIILVLISIAVISCDKSSPDCFKKAGDHAVVVRTLTPFKNILLESNIELVLQKGPEHKAEIIGPKNLLEKVLTSVGEGTLTIDNKNACNFVRGYKHHLLVIVTAPEFDMVISNSIGTITTEKEFVQDTMFFYTEGGDLTINGTFNELKTGSHGNGNVYYKGITDQMFVYMNGTNYLYAEEGTVNNYVFVETYSLADAYITAPTNGTFEYHIHKTGNIYYSGSPTYVFGKIQKTGTVIKK